MSALWWCPAGEGCGVLNTGHEGGERTAENDIWISKQTLIATHPHTLPTADFMLISDEAFRLDNTFSQFLLQDDNEKGEPCCGKCT